MEEKGSLYIAFMNTEDVADGVSDLEGPFPDMEAVDSCLVDRASSAACEIPHHRGECPFAQAMIFTLSRKVDVRIRLETAVKVEELL